MINNITKLEGHNSNCKWLQTACFKLIKSEQFTKGTLQFKALGSVCI